MINKLDLIIGLCKMGRLLFLIVINVKLINSLNGGEYVQLVN